MRFGHGVGRVGQGGVRWFVVAAATATIVVIFRFKTLVAHQADELLHGPTHYQS